MRNRSRDILVRSNNQTYLLSFVILSASRYILDKIILDFYFQSQLSMTLDSYRDRIIPRNDTLLTLINQSFMTYIKVFGTSILPSLETVAII